MKLKFGYLCGVLAVMLPLQPSNAIAGEADAPAVADAGKAAQDDSQGLEVVTVTARRIEENQQHVPVAVTTLSGAALERRNIDTVRDLQFDVPNLQVKQSQTYATVPEFIIRGQRQALTTDENVVTYVDGVPQGTRGLTLYDLKSVQVLKGPQGTLFGKNSNGGAMVFTTNPPVFNNEGMVELEYGNYDRKNVTAMINVPLIDGVVALRAAGNVERRDGVYENRYPGGRDLDDRHNESGRISLLVQPSDRLNNLTTFDYLHRREIPAPAVLQAAPLDAPGFGGLVSLLTQQAVTQQSALSGATPIIVGGTLLQRAGNPFVLSAPTGLGTTTPSFGNAVTPLNTFGDYVKTYGVANTTSFMLNDKLTIRNILGARYERADEQQDPSGAAGYVVNISPFLTGLGASGLPSYIPGQVANNNTNYQNETRAYTEELQLIGEFSHLRVIGGAFASRTELDYKVLSFFTVGPVSLYPYQSHHRYQELDSDSRALFAQGTYDFGSFGLDKLRFTLGLRYNWDKRSNLEHDFYSDSIQFSDNYTGVNQLCAVNSGTGGVSTGVNTATECRDFGTDHWRALTWTDSIEYQFTPDTLAYFTNRRGYKSGSANPNSLNLNYIFYNPEHLTDFELGLKQQGLLADMPYRLNIAGFIGKYKDIQTQDIISFCTVDCSQANPATYTDLIIFNVGNATIKGIEIEGTLKPLRQLQIDVGYSYQVGRYGAGSVIPQPLNSGPVGPGNPIDFTGGQNLSGVEFPGVPRQQANVAVSYEIPYVPATFAKTVLSMNYAYRTSSRGLTALGIYPWGGFGVANGRLTFNELFRSPVSVSLWTQNLTDKHYNNFCADNLNSIGYAACQWGEPRTYGMALSAHF